MSATIPITDADFEAEVINSPILTVTDFWAEWCAPCKRLAPILDQIAAEYAGRIKITKIDVDANPLTSARYEIQSLPTLLVFKDGHLVDTIFGFWPKERLVDRLLPHLS